ncbi:uncharacterized protein LOC114256921 [Camellia sinensis]|uniref:uncharacterized protein LOC114256921 n=1 Tax=Camellia sinensis TaxID=4442 RepID=UPI0010358010|nr:uncharacterized protein LOC114256921 [Camellia sinensis]
MDQDHDFWENSEWNDWQTTILQECNIVENVYRWACGRPTALQDRTRDSDEDDLHDRDFDVAALANNLSQAFRYSIYDNEDAEEGNGALDRVDEVIVFSFLFFFLHLFKSMVFSPSDSIEKKLKAG